MALGHLDWTWFNLVDRSGKCFLSYYILRESEIIWGAVTKAFFLIELLGLFTSMPHC